MTVGHSNHVPTYPYIRSGHATKALMLGYVVAWGDDMVTVDDDVLR
jgi:hypothetical protein